MTRNSTSRRRRGSCAGSWRAAITRPASRPRSWSTTSTSRSSPGTRGLSNILQAFNDLFGDIAWDDRDRVGELITKTIPARVAADAAFRNARENSDDANARIEHDKVLARIVTGMVKDDAELFKQFMDNDSFKRWMTDTVFSLAYEPAATP
jgi:type I restriction enzyme R subunit